MNHQDTNYQPAKVIKNEKSGTKKSYFEILEYSGNWIGDYVHENSNYMNVCKNCGNEFFGHKRRVRCKNCMGAYPSIPQQIFAKHYELASGKPCDEMILHHMQYAIDAMEEYKATTTRDSQGFLKGVDVDDTMGQEVSFDKAKAEFVKYRSMTRCDNTFHRFVDWLIDNNYKLIKNAKE